MIKLRCLFLIFSAIALVMNLFAGGIALSGAGARAMSMGGAFRGLADDYSAIFWNPAGIAYANNNTIALLSPIIIPKGEYTTSIQTWPGLHSGKQKTADKTWVLPNIYYVHEGNHSFNYGIGIYVPYGLGATWDMIDLPNTMYKDINNDGQLEAIPLTWPAGFPKEEFVSSISIIDAHPTLSYKISDQLSVGAGMSIYYGNIEITKFIPDATYSTYLPKIMKLNGTGYGFGANMGVFYRPNAVLSLGLSGKLPGTVKLKGDASIDVYLNNVTAPSVGLTQPSIIKMKPDAEATIDLPADAGVGIAWKVKPNWTCSADVVWTGWKSFDCINIELDGQTPQGTAIPDSKLETQWKNTYRYSIGTEYLFPKNISGRLGFFIDESPIPDNTLNPTWPDVSTKYSYNLGFGLPVSNKMYFDFQYENMQFAKREINGGVVINSETGLYENMPGKYQTTIQEFNLSLQYHF